MRRIYAIEVTPGTTGIAYYLTPKQDLTQRICLAILTTSNEVAVAAALVYRSSEAFHVMNLHAPNSTIRIVRVNVFDTAEELEDAE